MKQLILGIALVGLAFGCKNTDKNQVSDPSSAEMPAATCPAGGCSDSAKSDCGSSCEGGEEKASCCGTCK